MNTFRTTHHHPIATRAQRLDPRKECRFSLALVMLMGLATLSVMATTEALIDRNPEPSPSYSQR